MRPALMERIFTLSGEERVKERRLLSTIVLLRRIDLIKIAA